MDRIIKADLPMIKEEVSETEARKRIAALGEPYKLEILESILSRKSHDEQITIYHCGADWWDLCAGTHLQSTGQLDKNSIELTSVAGAYWRGNENNAMLSRIYGTAW